MSLVLASALDAVAGRTNSMSLVKAKAVVLVVVDGLGLQNLTDFAGHAPFLSQAQRANPGAIRAECPSTTVLSLASIATGVRAGEHGLIGYTVLDSISGERINLLSGWEQSDADPSDWKRRDTLAEQNPGSVVVVAPKAYQTSGFSTLTLAGAAYHGADGLEERFGLATKLATPGKVVYLYVPELDQLGHRFGPRSDQWVDALEQLDALVKQVVASATHVVLTADHGMVQVGPNNHIYLETCSSLQSIGFATAGDTRCAYLYLDEPDEVSSVKGALQAELESTCVVATWADLVAQGWQTAGESRARTPDLVVLAVGEVALYDRRSAKPQSLKMLGHHGSFTDAETRVPLIRWNV